MAAESNRLERIQRFWNEQSDWNAHVAIYDSPDVRDPRKREEAFEAAGELDARRLAGFLHPSSRVVDLGCGIGRVIRPLAGLCREIIGVDISTTMLDKARSYLDGLPQVRLVHTDGASLPSIEDASVDFVYSLLCLIHVDRRSAYRYLREIERVLRPDGLAFLEFQNILSAEGLAKFQSVVEGDYPLELYTLEELRALLGSVGLEILTCHETAEYLHLTVVRGRRDAWMGAVSEGISVEGLEATGLFAGSDVAGDGALRARLASRLPRPVTLTLSTGWVQADGTARFQGRGLLPLDRGQERQLGLHWDARGRRLAIELDGEPCSGLETTVADVGVPGPSLLQVGLLPPGFAWNQASQESFPQLFYSRELPSVG